MTAMAEFIGGPSDGKEIHPRLEGALFVCVRPAGLDEHHLYLPAGEGFRYVGPCDGASGQIEHEHWDVRAAQQDE